MRQAIYLTALGVLPPIYSVLLSARVLEKY